MWDKHNHIIHPYAQNDKQSHRRDFRNNAALTHAGGSGRLKGLNQNARKIRLPGFIRTAYKGLLVKLCANCKQT